MTTYSQGSAIADSSRDDALWLQHQLSPARGVRNAAAAAQVDRTLDPAAFEHAAHAVVSRHHHLRRGYSSAEEVISAATGVVLALAPDATPEVVHARVPATQLAEWLDELCARPFP